MRRVFILIVRFVRMPTAGKALLVEAALWLGLARLAILVLPFRILAPRLGIHRHETPGERQTTGEAVRAMTIARTIRQVARNAPWDCTCLVRAIAAKAMLRRRRIPSTLYLGVARAGEGDLSAHAWLRCGDAILTGQEEAVRYTVVSTFGDAPDEGKP